MHQDKDCQDCPGKKAFHSACKAKPLLNWTDFISSAFGLFCVSQTFPLLLRCQTAQQSELYKDFIEHYAGNPLIQTFYWHIINPEGTLSYLLSSAAGQSHPERSWDLWVTPTLRCWLWHRQAKCSKLQKINGGDGARATSESPHNSGHFLQNWKEKKEFGRRQGKKKTNTPVSCLFWESQELGV